MISDIDVKDKYTISIHKEFPIQKFNWTLEFIFRQGRYSDEESEIITKELRPYLDTEHYNMLSKLLDKNTYNSAIAVSNNSENKSIVIMTQVSSIGQFVNSLTHEMLHVSRHIDECNNNEELFTILGNISGDIISELYSK